MKKLIFAAPAVSLCLIAVLITTVPATARATTWYSIIDDTFNRSDTSVAGTASSTSGVGNSWTDTNGSIWNISSNKLLGTSNASSDYLTKFLLRPSSENATNQRIVATIPANENINGQFLGLALRWQPSTFNYYLAHIGTSGLYIYKIVGGATTLVTSYSVSLSASNSYSIDFSATSTNPTNISLVVTNLTSSTVVGIINTTDSESTLQTSGYYGLTTWYNSGVHAARASRVQTYNDTAPNSTPDTPTGLGPTGLVNGTATSTTQPQFSFTLSDPDIGDSLRYQIQIDDTADFSSPIIDYMFPGGPQGSKSFQVGQSGGSGAAYFAGNSGQTLSDGSYYWRVRASDGIASSTYTVANSGAVAFIVDTSPEEEQTVETTRSSIGSALPWCSGPLAPGWNVSLPGGGCGTTQEVIYTPAVPATTQACPAYSFSRTLRVGMKGEDVRALQKTMNCLGFTLATNGPGSSGEETTLFAQQTFAAVAKFQEAYAAAILAPIAASKGTGIFSTYSRKQLEMLTK